MSPLAECRACQRQDTPQYCPGERGQGQDAADPYQHYGKHCKDVKVAAWHGFAGKRRDVTQYTRRQAEDAFRNYSRSVRQPEPGSNGERNGDSELRYFNPGDRKPAAYSANHSAG